MYKTSQGYVFQTFRDGKVIFFHDSYKRHCGYRSVIRGEEGLNSIQETLIYPHLITSYPEINSSGRIIAHYKVYRAFVGKIRTSRGRELEYWEILLKKKPKMKRKIVTAFITSALEYAIINNRVENKTEYKRRF